MKNRFDFALSLFWQEFLDILETYPAIESGSRILGAKKLGLTLFPFP